MLYVARRTCAICCEACVLYAAWRAYYMPRGVRTICGVECVLCRVACVLCVAWRVYYVAWRVYYVA